MTSLNISSVLEYLKNAITKSYQTFASCHLIISLKLLLLIFQITKGNTSVLKDF